jgi:hypothetical protein
MANLDPLFVAAVKTLAENNTLREVLRRIESQCIAAWRTASNPEAREHAWYMAKAVDALTVEILSLTSDEKVREFNAKTRRVS